MNATFFARIIAWAAAINAVIVAAMLAFQPFAGDYPVIAQVMTVLAMISAVITPFLPRAQGVPEKK